MSFLTFVNFPLPTSHGSRERMGTVVPQVSASARLTVAPRQMTSASFINSFRVAVLAERLAIHVQPGSISNATEFFNLCVSLARGIDYAIANNEVPTKARDLPSLLKQILAFLEVKPGYEAYMIDFHISKNTSHSPQEKIRLFVAQRDNMETSACIISPQHVNILLNGKGIERRTNVSMDTGPQMPTIVTPKYGTNLLQAIGQFNGHYIIAVAFMSVVLLPDPSALPDYVPSDATAADPDSDIIEGPSRVSLNCPISYTRIKIPIKGRTCKHLQCFDFRNFVDINSRRPSWRCPHYIQHVCYSDIRVDQNMVNVLKEVGDIVVDVIISADGSWKAVLESDDDTVKICKETINCQNEMREQQEPATSIAFPIDLDLTGDDDRMDVVSTNDVEDRKPFQDTLQSQPVATNLTMPSLLNNANAADQNVTHQALDGLLSGVYFNQGSELAPANILGSFAMSSSLIFDIGGHAVNSLTSPMQNQISASGDLQQSQLVNETVNNEYGRLTNIPRHVNRTPVACVALPVTSQTSVEQQRSITNCESPNCSPLTSQAALPPANGFDMASNHMDMQQQFFRSPPNPHQQPFQDRPFISEQWVRQVVGLPTASQLGLGNEPQNLNQQQALRMHQARSQSLGVGGSPLVLPWVQTQQEAAQVGVGNTAGFPSSQQTRFTAAAPPQVQMTRELPTAPVPLQESRGNLYSNTDATRAPAAVQRGNIGAASQVKSGTDGTVDLPSEQNWQPAGRMRGSLSGQAAAAAAAYRDLIIRSTQPVQPLRPTQPTQPPRPPVPSPSPSVPRHLQRFFF